MNWNCSNKLKGVFFTVIAVGLMILGLQARTTQKELLELKSIAIIDQECIQNLYYQISQNKSAQVKMISNAMQSVVKVVCEDDRISSGFYIGNGIIVTAGHVLENNIEKVVFEDGAEYKILEQIKHPGYDCGFIMIGDVNEPALKFDLVDTQCGEEVFILGNPSGFTFTATKGIIVGRSDFNKYFGDTQLIVSDAAAQGGNSGSALVDIDGEIRGLWVGGRTSRCGAFLTGCGASICTKDILKALEYAGLGID